MLTAVTAFLGKQLSGLAIGALIPVLFMVLMKLIPSKLGSMFASLLNQQVKNIDKIEDPKRKELVKALALDLVRLAEHELPDTGSGSKKYELVSERLCKILPFLKGQEDRIRDLIEASVEAMDQQLKDQIAK